jgi:hypothetical protein
VGSQPVVDGLDLLGASSWLASVLGDNAGVSRLTDVVVIGAWQDVPMMEPFTHGEEDDDREWSGKFGHIGGREADRFWSTGKGSPEGIWVATFNHLNRSALLADLERLPWSAPYTVQVLIRDEEDDCFGLWMIFDGELREVPIPRTERRGSVIPGVLSRTDRPGGP